MHPVMPIMTVVLIVTAIPMMLVAVVTVVVVVGPGSRGQERHGDAPEQYAEKEFYYHWCVFLGFSWDD